jgi:hypothetical protein
MSYWSASVDWSVEVINYQRAEDTAAEILPLHDLLDLSFELAVRAGTASGQLLRLAEGQTRIGEREPSQRFVHILVEGIAAPIEGYGDSRGAKQFQVAVEAAHVEPQAADQRLAFLGPRSEQLE